MLYVYESSPTCELKYVIKLGKIVKYPELINEKGLGNKEFNEGLKTKFAYQIKEIYKLEEPIE